MKLKNKNLITGLIVALAVLIASLNIVSAQIAGNYQSSAFTQYNTPTFQQFYSSQGIDYKTFWPSLDGSCDSRGDFIVNVRPGGCSPAVVRSDLLEEQNVPVFCKLDAVKLNPIVDIASLKSVGFQVRDVDKYIAGVSYHPSQIALRIYQPVLNNPLMNDVGYAVVVLKRQINESSMPDFVEANLTAVLTYDMKNIFGAGQTNFFLPVISEQEWNSEYNKYSFWKGRGYLRANWIEQDKAEIAIYNDAESIIRKVVLAKGQTSDRIDMPGFYCRAGVRVQLTDLSSGKSRIRLQVDDNDFWLVEGEKFLDNCYVKSIKQIGAGGQATLRCFGKDYVLRVGISDKALISFDEGATSKEFSLGEAIDAPDNIYLSYIGQAKEDLTAGNTENNPERTFIVLVKTPEKTEKIDEVTKIKQETLVQIADNFNSWMRDASNNKKSNEKWYETDNIRTNLANALGTSKDNVEIIFNGTNGKQEIAISGKKSKPFGNYKFIEIIGVKDVNYKTLSTTASAGAAIRPALLEDYFAETSKRAYEIVNLYGSEKDSLGEYYGARVLAELADLAGKLGKQKTQLGILRNLTSRYSSSSYAKYAAAKLDDLAFYNYENAASFVISGTESHYLKLLQVIEPGVDEASVKFTKKMKNSDVTSKIILRLNEKISIDNKDINSESLEIKELQEELIRLDYKHRLKDTDNTPASEIKYIKKGETITLKTYDKTNKPAQELSLTLDEINLKKLAQISLISEMPDGISHANFTVRIGVEKRAVKLNPDKTKDRIENLNNSIKDFSRIVEKLGKVVKTWKGACFATSGFLIVKNLFTNMGGRSLAREEVMKNYWKSFCSKEASERGIKVEQCYAEHNSDIEKSVDNYASSIKEMNSLADSLKGANAEETQKNYVAAFKNHVKNNKNQVVDKQGNKLIDVFGGIENSDATIDRMVKEGSLRVEEMRNIMLDSKLVSSNPEIGNKLLERDINPVYEVAKREAFVSGYGNLEKNLAPIQTGIGDPGKIGRTPFVKVSSLSEEQAGDFYEQTGTSHLPGDNFIVIPTYTNANLGPGKDYSNQVLYVPLEKKGNTYSLAAKEGYVLNENGDVVKTVPKEDLNQILRKMGVANFQEINAGLCNNKYLNAKVKFYETEPYKGMPAVVPLDVNKGWYAATKQILPGFGMTPYKSSGAVSSLWLCNVGKNNREEFDILNDDICIQLNYDTGQPQGQLMCLSEGEARRLASNAKSSIENAASQYKTLKGRGAITINGQRFPVEKAVSSVGTECTDFMSPSDCNLMFNVCDPVLCPSSRCNLGGSFHVDDVVQSGIIGSIALCLPNFGSPSQGGVVVPVCLTGIYAGLDAYVSILKAHKQCLEENLKTGAFTGICDEIYSIYLCEFFWRQGAPLLDMALPKIVEMLYTGGKTRGGGEYMTVTHAWDNAQNSLRYFTDYYAVNAMKAFQARSTSEVGTEICKAFISSNYPSSKKMLDKLLEPESPVQFYAKFDEIAYSDVTLPSTSQYKVYYHIFAGREQGHYFQVYLKNPPETSSYAAQPVIYVDSGYIGIGQYATQTKDFTAPSGYKELCVRIDTQEECGFKQVTTSFAVDYLKDLYMKEQGTEAITSEKTCVSGTTSLYSLANPNLQEAGQEMLQPAIYKRGLIRVCATNNPGNATDLGRWKDVGYCSDTRIRCWLDSVSVENVIQDSSLEKQTMTKAEEIMNKEALDKGNLYTEDTSNSKLKDAWTLFKKIIWADIFSEDLNAFITRNPVYRANIKDVVKVRDDAEDLSQKAFFNNQKVDAMFLGFEVYSKLLSRLADIMKISSDSGTTSPAVQTPVTSAPAETSSTWFKLEDNKIYYDEKYIKLYLEAASNGGFKIYDDDFLFELFDDEIGVIFPDGAISFTKIKDADKQWYMEELEEKWKFEGGNFVLKPGATPAAPTTTPATTGVVVRNNVIFKLNNNPVTGTINTNTGASIKINFDCGDGWKYTIYKEGESRGAGQSGQGKNEIDISNDLRQGTAKYTIEACCKDRTSADCKPVDIKRLIVNMVPGVQVEPSFNLVVNFNSGGISTIPFDGRTTAPLTFFEKFVASSSDCNKYNLYISKKRDDTWDALLSTEKFSGTLDLFKTLENNGEGTYRIEAECLDPPGDRQIVTAVIGRIR